MNRWLGGETGAAGGGARQTRWLTPPAIPASLGRFDLDPCGAPGHNLARETYLLERGQDGLTLPWFGRVWLNPPYGSLMAPFLSRLAEHGNGVALIFARTDTAAFHDLVWAKASAILFLRGRIHFLDERGERAKANAGAPSCLVAYGEMNTYALARCGQDGELIFLNNLT